MRIMDYSWDFARGMLTILLIYCVISLSLLAIAFWLEDRKNNRDKDDREVGE